LVGKTASNFNTVGAEIRNDGRIFGISSGNNPITLNRKTDDGTIIDLRKDGTEVGRIGTAGGDIVVGTGNIGLRFNDAANTVEPWDINSNNSENDTIDLGYSGGRFKDLYLGGGLYVGGTGSANYLDDYEEGTWTMTVLNQTTDTNQVSTYTKIGNVVYIIAKFTCDTNTTNFTTSAVLGGFPFTAIDTNRAQMIFRGYNLNAVSGSEGAPTLGINQALISGFASGGIKSTVTPMSSTGSNPYYRQNIFKNGTTITLTGFYFTDS